MKIPLSISELFYINVSNKSRVNLLKQREATRPFKWLFNQVLRFLFTLFKMGQVNNDIHFAVCILVRSRYVEHTY